MKPGEKKIVFIVFKQTIKKIFLAKTRICIFHNFAGFAFFMISRQALRWNMMIKSRIKLKPGKTGRLNYDELNDFN